jgi:hypothetical protein
VSGNLELLDFDDRDVHEQFKVAAVAVGLGDLVQRVEVGYREDTPRGVHWFYRCDDVRPNAKLAERVGPVDPKTGRPTRKALIETRGEGGYVIVAPSGGAVHPDGLEYRLTAGGIATIATISPEERDALWDLARTFDEVPKPLPVEKPAKSKGNGQLRGWSEEPGKAYSRDVTWADLLEPRGWVEVFTRGETTYWRRPGKTWGHSATTNHNGSDCLHVFSGSVDLEPNTSYTKFGVYAYWNHGGDFTAAARALHEVGYGTSAEHTESRGPGAAARSEKPREWGPIRLGQTFEVLPFPIEVLPPELARLAQEIANAIGIDVGVPAMQMLAIASGLIGSADSLLIEANRFASSTLFAVVIGVPGDGKTPSLNYVKEAASEIERELVREFLERKEAYLEQLLEYTKTPKGQRGAPPQKPLPQRVVYDIGTNEAWFRAWATPGNEKGGVIICDELRTLFDGWNQFKRAGNDRQVFLQLWTNQSMTIDRVQANEFSEPIRISHPHISIIGNLTPSSLASCFAADDGDGFRARFLNYFPDRRPRLKSRERSPVSDGALGAWRDVIQRLRKRERKIDPATGCTHPRTIVFTKAARALYHEFADRQIDETADPDFDDELLGTWSKLEVYFGRFCLVLTLLHAAADPTAGDQAWPDCSAAVVSHAWQLVSCFKSHARRLLGRVQAEGAGGMPHGAQLVLNWLRARPEATEVSFRDITRAYPARDYSRAKMEDGVAWLVKRNVLRAVIAPESETTVRGRTAGPAWEINPEFRETCVVQPIQQKQQNYGIEPGQSAPDGTFADSAVLAVHMESTESPEEGEWIA